MESLYNVHTHFVLTVLMMGNVITAMVKAESVLQFTGKEELPFSVVQYASALNCVLS